MYASAERLGVAYRYEARRPFPPLSRHVNGFVWGGASPTCTCPGAICCAATKGGAVPSDGNLKPIEGARGFYVKVGAEGRLRRPRRQTRPIPARATPRSDRLAGSGTVATSPASENEALNGA